MVFTVALLGTDTNYTPTPNPDARSYFGETLSIVADTIAQDAKINIDPITRAGGGDKAVVIEGPDTLGYEVGQRISRAVISILNAVMRGETNIKIIAHSRGAVEAILVAHELQRIQKLFSDKNLPTLEKLTDSSDRTNRKLAIDYSTHYAMNTTLKEEFNQLHSMLRRELSTVTENLPQLKFDIFNIDPVPGGNSALGNIFPTLWYDERYFTIPSNVQTYEQCVYQHENSRSFKAIIPKPESEQTQVNLFDLPGHHGTGSGNIYDHEKTQASTKKLGLPEQARSKTGHVQELMILKIVEFLQQGNDPVQLKLKSNITEKLDKQLLDLIYQPSGEVRSQEQLKARQLDAYKFIHENKELYEEFKDSHYASAAPEFLTREQGYIRWMPSFTGLKEVSDRIVHFQEYKDFFLRNVMPQVDTPYVNQDHFSRHFSAVLNSLFDISERDKPVEKLFKMAEKLVRLCRHLDFDNPTQSRIETEEKIPDYLEKLKRLNQDQTYFPRVFNGLIQASINDYLAQGMSADFRQRFLSQITDTLKELKAFSVAAQTKPHSGVELAHVLLNSIEQGVRTTFERRADQLYIQSISIEAMLSKTPAIIGRDLLKKWNDMCAKLSQKPTASSTLRGLVECHTINFQGLEQNDWLDLKQAINQALSTSTGFTNPNNAYSSEDRPFLAYIADSFDDALQALQELDNQEENIKKAALHCRELESYISTVENEDLWKIVSVNTPSSQDRDAHLSVLKKKHKGLIEQLANYIVKNNIPKSDSTEPLVGLSPDSLNAVEEIIAKLALSRAHPDIRAELQSSKAAMTSLQALEAEKSTLQSELLSQTLHFKTELKKKVSELAEKDALLKAQADAAAQAVQTMAMQHAAAIQSLEAKLKPLQDQLSLKEGSQQATIQADQLRIQELEEQCAGLQQHVQQLQENHEQVFQDNAALRIEVEQKNEQLLLLNQDILCKQAALHDNQDKEVICFDIIEKKLLPMTQKYLQHLNEAYDSISGDPNSDEVKARRAPISSKLREVLILERILNGASIAPDIDNPRKNQTAILAFYDRLEAANNNLKPHRDKSWQRYVANVAKVASIVLTGIIPGLIALGIISAVGQSPKFWQSHGQRFFAQAEKDKPKDIENKPKPQV